jgi:4-hydroxy-tetrahydrodipicolinate synthase
MNAETTLRLAQDFSNIVAVKEASGDLDQISSIIEHKPSDFLVISGDDALTLPMITLGADGLISVVGNAFPTETARLVHKAVDGDVEAAKNEHFKLKDIIENLFVEGNPAGVKECLKHAAISQNFVRLPLLPVSQVTSERIYRLMAEKELVRQL